MRIIAFAILVTGSGVAASQPPEAVPKMLGSAYMAVCEKIQNCARAEFSLNEIPAEHAPVLDAALDGLCVGVYQSVERLAVYPDLHAPALACGQQLLLLSCDDLAEDRQIGVCAELIKQAEQYGLTLN